MSARSRLDAICAALPEVTAQEQGAHVGYSVRGKRFAWLLEDHHGDGRLALNCKAAPGESSALADRDPQLYFSPAYLGARGWAGAWLDVPEVDWQEIERLVVGAYLMTAPKRLARELSARSP